MQDVALMQDALGSRVGDADPRLLSLALGHSAKCRPHPPHRRTRLRLYLGYGHTQRRNGHPHARGDEPAHALFVTVR